MEYKIYIDRLKDGHIEKIAEVIPGSFLNVQESDLSFQEDITVSGEAYLAHDLLIIKLQAKTVALIPCTICNTKVKVPIFVSNFYHTQQISEIRSCIFDYFELLREDILLEVPPYAECDKGNCPERKILSPFLSEKKTMASIHHFPFADLDKK